MKNIVAFTKKHWTWISGLVGVVWAYVSPGAITALSNAASKHPVLAAAVAAITAVTAAVGPSPLSKGAQ